MSPAAPKRPCWPASKAWSEPRASASRAPAPQAQQKAPQGAFSFDGSTRPGLRKVSTLKQAVGPGIRGRERWSKLLAPRPASHPHHCQFGAHARRHPDSSAPSQAHAARAPAHPAKASCWARALSPAGGTSGLTPKKQPRMQAPGSSALPRSTSPRSGCGRPEHTAAGPASSVAWRRQVPSGAAQWPAAAAQSITTLSIAAQPISAQTAPRHRARPRID